MPRLGEIRAIAGLAYLAGLHSFVAPVKGEDFSGLDVFERYPVHYRHLILTRLRWDHDAGHHAWHERDFPFCVRCTSGAYQRLGLPSPGRPRRRQSSIVRTSYVSRAVIEAE